MAKHSTRNQRLGWVLFVLYLGALFYLMFFADMAERGLGWALIPEVALDNFKGYVKPCTFENGEPFVRRTYIFCQRDAAALPQVKLFMDMLKKHR